MILFDNFISIRNGVAFLFAIGSVGRQAVLCGQPASAVAGGLR